MKSELAAVEMKGEKYLLEIFLEVRIKKIGIFFILEYYVKDSWVFNLLRAIK